MQQQQIRLHEIIWEITGYCENKCQYCGSKEVADSEINEDRIIAIAREISKYPPIEIDISGGDPLCVSPGTHNMIHSLLVSSGVQAVKIIVNPKSLKPERTLSYENSLRTLQTYDWIGLSVSTHTELTKARALFEDSEAFNIFNNKCTIITNFNVGNVFLFNKIKWFVQRYNLLWQIQFTMFEDSDNQQALYNNDVALNEFFVDHVREAILEGIPGQIILADNMTDLPCGAGTKSIGILENGDIVPCLSMRSWCKSLEAEGNILTAPLKTIWEKGFNRYRFSEFQCCKDSCKNKNVRQDVFKDTKKRELSIKDIKKILENPMAPFNPYMDDGTQVYAVRGNQVMVYAVIHTRTVSRKDDEE